MIVQDVHLSSNFQFNEAGEMGKILWEPNSKQITDANITRFREYVNTNYALNLKSYSDLYEWSVSNISEFWESVWDFTGVIGNRGHEHAIDDITRFPGAEWFKDTKLNFARNLLRFADDRQAITFTNESRGKRAISYEALSRAVVGLGSSLKSSIRAGDRACAYMPNLPETIIAMLATTSIGATWAACGTELGSAAVISRLGQIEPKILFAVDGYRYRGNTFDTLSNVEAILEQVPTIEKVIIFPYLESKPDIKRIPSSVSYDDFVDSNPNPRKTDFEEFSFDHPLYVMFSSGTTGQPKCMVQGAGGVLLNHLKELVLHTDLKRDDKITYIASPSWMMWNWLVSSLAVGATLFLYDGDPNYPDWRTLWRSIEKEQITIFGCSASYINHLKTVGARPRDEFNLTSLREISQTGSTLSEEGFAWIYEEIKKDLHFNSISGGTDINGCFAIGNPTIPVHAGELQSPGLGMKIKSYDQQGNPIYDKEGELVCEAPAPSMPLYFWNDRNNEKYQDTYFKFYTFAGKNVWRHGDYIVFHSDTGGISFRGRSDSVLKPSGVRIGTAEIYSIVEEISGIRDSLAVGQEWNGSQRVVLFVQLQSGVTLTDELKARIKNALREKASPRHVPSLIIETPAIPYTFSNKKVEVAVANIMNGRPVTNKDAIMNPDSLEFYKNVTSEVSV